MEKPKPNIPFLQPGEKVIGNAYLTPEEEIVFTSSPGSSAVVLIEPPPGSSGPWAVRLRPPARTRAGGAGGT